jgi:hypothetical protein
MPTRKQRRRRDKTFRHEYDLVVYDEEGNEVTVAAPELRKEKEKDSPKRNAPQKRGGRTARPIREVEPASWRRALRRGGLMGGVMMLIVLFFFQDMPLASRIGLGVIYAAAFVPFTYWIDRIAYRNYLRRSGKT